MPAAYQRHQATGSHGGQGSRSALRPSTQWTGSDHTSGSAPATPGSSSQEEGIVFARGLEDERLHHANRASGWALLAHPARQSTLRNLAIFAIMTFVLFGGAWVMRRDMKLLSAGDERPTDEYFPPVPQLPVATSGRLETKNTDPVQWLRDNTQVNIDHLSSVEIEKLQDTRPKAAFIALARNSELSDMIESIKQVETRFNSRVTHRYDWVFFNNEEFTENFIAGVTKATQSQCYFEVIPHKHWSVPSWIDQSRFDVARQFMGGIGVGKAWLESYHHMCRWNSGLFALEKRLANYDYYWRVEPGVQYSCDINYDVFRFMQDNHMAYGFNIALLEDGRAIPSFWDGVMEFMLTHDDMVDEKADISWLLQDPKHQDGTGRSPLDYDGNEQEYNNCQFYSNFEVGSLGFFRGEKHMAFFEYLDKKGFFFYERLGDAPVHTLSVSMFLAKDQVWYFRDIGYSHSICAQCPPHTTESGVDAESMGRRSDERAGEVTNRVVDAEFPIGAAYAAPRNAPHDAPCDVPHDTIHETPYNAAKHEANDAGSNPSREVAPDLSNNVHTEAKRDRAIEVTTDVVGRESSDVPMKITSREGQGLVYKGFSKGGSAEISGQIPKTMTTDISEGASGIILMDIPYHHRWLRMYKDVKRQTTIPGLSCGCTVAAIDNNNSKLAPFESKQRKPSDTCIRRWLGGRWLEKKPGWSRQADIAAGGDGYGGYVLDSLLRKGKPTFLYYY